MIFAQIWSVLWILPQDPETPPSGTTIDTKENIPQRLNSQKTIRKKIERRQGRGDGRKNAIFVENRVFAGLNPYFALISGFATMKWLVETATQNAVKQYFTHRRQIAKPNGR